MWASGLASTTPSRQRNWYVLKDLPLWYGHSSNDEWKSMSRSYRWIVVLPSWYIWYLYAGTIVGVRGNQCLVPSWCGWAYNRKCRRPRQPKRDVYRTILTRMSNSKIIGTLQLDGAKCNVNCWLNCNVNEESTFWCRHYSRTFSLIAKNRHVRTKHAQQPWCCSRLWRCMRIKNLNWLHAYTATTWEGPRNGGPQPSVWFGMWTNTIMSSCVCRGRKPVHTSVTCQMNCVCL